MVRAFSEEESKKIYNNLLKKGREFAIEYGYKNTSVDQIINEVNVSKGTFYRFFASKEDFFFKVREEVELEIKTIIGSMFKGKLTKDKIVDNFCEVFELINSHNYKVFFDYEELDYLFRKLPENKKKQDLQNDILAVDNILRLVGITKINEEEKEIITGLIRSIFLVSMNGESIGNEIILKKVIRYQIECFIEYVSKF